jgi:flavin-dependent dehydrogenase
MYDVIILGARCAGSPTAMLLARKGYRVLLVDRATFPSDMVMSTHLIWQPGVASMKRWGLLEKIQASGCPAIGKLMVDLGPFTLVGSPPPAEGVADAYSPRRTVLDKILVDGAVAAGAELREGFSVSEVLVDGGRATGIRGTSSGATVTEHGRLVIGADGMHSMVARSVGAPQYNARPPLQGTYFTYWSGVAIEGVEYYVREYRAVYGWMTNDGLALIGVNWTAKDFPAVRTDVEASYRDVLGACAPALAERVRSGRREGRWIGGAIPNFFHRAHGPGWALVGDAGYTKDPCTAQGITDAFRDAEILADAVDAGLSGGQPLEESLADYERRRNEIATPFYEFTCQLAPFDPPPPEMLQLYAALRGNQSETDRFCGVIAETVGVADFFAPANVERIIRAARK